MDIVTFLKTWLGQSTTGQGATAVLGAALAAGTGQLAWPAAWAIIIPAMLLVVWPQRHVSTTDAKELTDDGKAIIAAYRTSASAGATPAQAIAAALLNPQAGPALLEDIMRILRTTPPVAVVPVSVVGDPSTGTASDPAPSAPSATRSAGVLGCLVALLLTGLVACTPAQTGQSLAALETGYTAASSIEVQAAQGKLPGVIMTRADIDTYKVLDNAVYSQLVTLQKIRETGGTPTAQALAALSASLVQLQEFLNKKGIK